MIEIYSKDNCAFCKAAKDLLDVNNVEYTDHRIGRDITRDEFIEKFPEVKTVPAILVDSKFIGGYNELLNYLSKKDT